MITVFTAISFLPVLANGFVDWDEEILANSSHYQKLGWSALRWILSNFHSGIYQPVTWITFALDQLLWWQDPFGYHLTSLLIHCASAGVFFFVALELFKRLYSQPTDAQSGHVKTAAFLAALFFALHPLRAEPVAWSGARGDLLSGLFLLLSVLRYLGSGSALQERSLWQYWTTSSAFFYLLSSLARPSGLALPVILVLLDLHSLGRLALGPKEWFAPQSRVVLWRSLPFFVMAVGSLAWTVLTTGAASLENSPSGANRFLCMLVAPAFYLYKTIFPLNLSPTYELSSPVAAGAAIVTVAITVGLFVAKQQWPVLAVTWLAYVVTAWSVLMIGEVNLPLLADRQSYLSSLPLAFLAGAVLLNVLELKNGTVRWRFSLSYGLAALVCLGLGALTWKQAQVWQNSETLWRHAVAVSQSSAAYRHRAARLEAEGKDEDAIQDYQRAAVIDPMNWDTHYRLGLLLQSKSRVQEAIEQYRTASQINPSAAEPQNQLAFVLMRQGDLNEAAKYYQSVLELTSRDEQTSQSRLKRDRHFRKMTERVPDPGEAHFRLGVIAALQRDYDKATHHLQKAVAITPDSEEAFYSLGLARAGLGDLNEAVEYFRKAVQIRPSYGQAHESLGRALAAQGKKPEAEKHLEEAIRILKLSPAPR
jgi:tetratricopeptide (TPR) repeat protein